MVTLADATVAELLEQLAARTPAPAGGSAAALAGALAAALTEMAAAFALSRSTEVDESVRSLHVRAGALRVELLQLADADLLAYQPVLDALGLAREDERRTPALRDAQSAAAQVPLQIATASAEVAELAAAISQMPGNGLLLGDLTTALAVAEAAAGAAAALVDLNLEAIPEDLRMQQARALARRAAELRSRQRT